MVTYKKKPYLILALLLCFPVCAKSQFIFGTTGLLHLPTADMQRDKTVMLGGGYLSKYATPDKWDYDTWNYYLNVTFFPWLEVSYTMNMFSGKYMSEWTGLDISKFKKWTNQDRNFSFRIRAWKEGWWKSWTPQIVLGTNDLLHTFNQGGSGNVGLKNFETNGFWARMYIAATKHFLLNKVGTFGIHAAYLYNDRKDFKYEGIGVGGNLLLNALSCKWLQSVNLMVEYDTRTVNVGMGYSLWKERINLACELNELKYFSGGIYFKIYLK